MTTLAALRPWFRAASIVACLALVACSGTVTGGADSEAHAVTEQGNGGSPATPSCGGGGPASSPTGTLTAIAATAAQLGYADEGTGGGSGVDPSTVYLQLGSPAPTCKSPQLAVVCGLTGVSIGVPAALLQVGTIQLSNPALDATFSESGNSAGPDPTTCPGGGGSFVTGTLIIDAVDATSVTFMLSDTQSFDFSSGSADGTYVATRCP